MSKFDRLSALVSRFQLSVRTCDDREANLIIFNGADGRPSRIELFPKTALFEVNEEIALAVRADWGGEGNPLVAALPARVTLDLTTDAQTASLASVLCAEAQAQRCGSATVLDRIGEVLMISLIRHQIECGYAEPGLLAGLADARLHRAIVAIHDHPGRPWRNDELAEIAGLSLSRFSEYFAKIVGETPIAYLRRWRMVLAKQDIERGDRVQAVARRYGYRSGEALSRAFKKTYNCVPVSLRHAS